MNDNEKTLGEMLADAFGNDGAEMSPHDAMLIAGGDPDILTELADEARRLAALAGDPMCLLLLGEAMAYARLAAAQDAPEHKRALVSLLDYVAAILESQGNRNAADHISGQALLLAEYLAEEGDDLVADVVAARAGRLTPEAHRQAKEMRELTRPERVGG